MELPFVSMGGIYSTYTHFHHLATRIPCNTSNATRSGVKQKANHRRRKKDVDSEDEEPAPARNAIAHARNEPNDRGSVNAPDPIQRPVKSGGRFNDNVSTISERLASPTGTLFCAYRIKPKPSIGI